MSDLVELLTKAMDRHATWEDDQNHRFTFSVDTDIDVTPYRIPSFWEAPPDRGVVYDMDDAVRMMEGDTSYTSSIIRERSFSLFTDANGPVPDHVSSRDYAVRTDGKFQYGTVTTGGTKDEAGNFIIPLSAILSVISPGGEKHLVSLFALFAFIASNDARADGRTEDAMVLARALSLIPDPIVSLTKEQADQVLSHALRAFEAARRRKTPMVIRAGRRWTQAMGATSRQGTFEHEDGGAFVMAGDLMITADKADALSLSVGEKKTLAYFNHLATLSGYGYEADRSCIVRTTIDEILETRGLEPTRKNRDRARKDVKKLARQAWEFEDTSTHEWVRIPLTGGSAQIRRGGAVEFALSSDYMRLVLNPRAGMLPVDPALLMTDDKRNPHAFTIGYKLTTHTYQNHGKPNQCTLSVERLLDYVETIPKPREVTAKNYTQRIIEPMERDLEALVACGVLAWWDYCHAKGEPLTDDEQAKRLDADGNDGVLPYHIAVNAYLQWKFTHEYAEHMAKVQESRERRRAEALEARKRELQRAERMQKRKERRIADRLADQVIARAGKEENAPSP